MSPLRAARARSAAARRPAMPVSGTEDKRPMITTTRRAFTQLGVLLPAASLLTRAAGAADAPVRIGCPYPLSGGAASAGQASRAAIEVAVDIINNPHPELAALPLAATAGLPGLSGRKVE